MVRRSIAVGKIAAPVLVLVLGWFMFMADEAYLNLLLHELRTDLSDSELRQTDYRVYRDCRDVLCTLHLAPPRELTVQWIYQAPGARADDLLHGHREQMAKQGWTVTVSLFAVVGRKTEYEVEMVGDPIGQDPKTIWVNIRWAPGWYGQLPAAS